MKIIEAINAMISNPQKITNVTKGTNFKEFFFLYNYKYKWSEVLNQDGGYTLFLYPKEERSVEELAKLGELEWSLQDIVTFKSEDLKTREATESFSDLYQLLSTKVNGVDDILNDIISDDLF